MLVQGAMTARVDLDLHSKKVSSFALLDVSLTTSNRVRYE